MSEIFEELKFQSAAAAQHIALGREQGLREAAAICTERANFHLRILPMNVLDYEAKNEAELLSQKILAAIKQVNRTP